MRYRLNEYTIVGDTIELYTDVTIEDIRLIVNETQGVVICSSMQKSNITNITTRDTGFSTITIPTSVCELAEGDKLTIEIDKGDSIDTIKGDNQEATNSKILEEIRDVKGTFNNLDIPISAISGLALELSDGKTNIVNALYNRGIEADSDKDTLTNLADKVYNITNPVVSTLPSESSTETANLIFDAIFGSQDYSGRYESVKVQYCGEGKIYEGCLMVEYARGTGTTITLTGADAYYVLEDDMFYKRGEDGNLIQFINGSDVQLSTKVHTLNFLNTAFTVFYLFLPDSTADYKINRTYASRIDYCKNTPLKYYPSTGTITSIYLHVSNPDTIIILPGGNTVGGAMFYYSNIEVLRGKFISNVNNSSYSYNYYYYNPNLRIVDSGAINVPLTGVRKVEFPNVEEANGTLVHGSMITELHLPKLNKIGATAGVGIIYECSTLKDLYLADNVDISSTIVGVNVNSSTNIKLLRVHCKKITDTRNLTTTATSQATFMRCIEQEFYGLESCNIYMGSTGSYTDATKRLYIECKGSRTDLIKFIHSSHVNASKSLTDIEISEGTRQPLYFYSFTGLTVENIVNHIFEKLADNSFEDDGVTPSEPITITLGSTVLGYLTDEQKAIATNKNYILA